jgi:hypothetical protein
MPDQRNIANVLEPHYGKQSPALEKPPKQNRVIHLATQIFPGHVRVFPTVRGNHRTIRCGCVVDHCADVIELGRFTWADHHLPGESIASKPDGRALPAALVIALRRVHALSGTSAST